MAYTDFPVPSLRAVVDFLRVCQRQPNVNELVVIDHQRMRQCCRELGLSKVPNLHFGWFYRPGVGAYIFETRSVHIFLQVLMGLDGSRTPVPTAVEKDLNQILAHELRHAWQDETGRMRGQRLAETSAKVLRWVIAIALGLLTLGWPYVTWWRILLACINGPLAYWLVDIGTEHLYLEVFYKHLWIEKDAHSFAERVMAFDHWRGIISLTDEGRALMQRGPVPTIFADLSPPLRWALQRFVSKRTPM